MKPGESYRDYSRRIGLETRDKLRDMTPVETKKSEKKKESSFLLYSALFPSFWLIFVYLDI